MDQVILIDSQVNPNNPSGASQSFSSQVLLNRLSLFLDGVYIATNFITDLNFIQFLSRRGIIHCDSF